MPSEQLVKALSELEREEITPPTSAALKWIMATSGITSTALASEELQKSVISLRYSYLKDVREKMDKAFIQEGSGQKNEELYNELSQRHWRMYAAVQLGLRSEEEAKWIQGRRQYWAKTNQGDVALDNGHLQSYKGSAQLLGMFSKRLALWKGMLDDIENGLSPLDSEVVRSRLDEEIVKPFNPSVNEIESTRRQLSSYDSEASSGRALNLLTSEHNTHLEKLSQWRTALEETAHSPKRARP